MPEKKFYLKNLVSNSVYGGPFDSHDDAARHYVHKYKTYHKKGGVLPLQVVKRQVGPKYWFYQYYEDVKGWVLNNGMYSWNEVQKYVYFIEKNNKHVIVSGCLGRESMHE